MTLVVDCHTDTTSTRTVSGTVVGADVVSPDTGEPFVPARISATYRNCNDGPWVLHSVNLCADPEEWNWTFGQFSNPGMPEWVRQFADYYRGE